MKLQMSAAKLPATLAPTAEMNLFRQLLTSRAGMTFEDSRHAFLEGRVRGRMTKVGARSLYEYYRMVAAPTGARELQELVDEVSINETSFFRMPSHFEFLAQTALPARLRVRREARSKRLRIWSAGCSTGQEVYSIAMVYLETAVFHESWELQLVGTDISAKALAQARAAAYDKRQLNDVSPARRQMFFDRKGERYGVRAWVKKSIDFMRGNILDGPPWGDADIVFCRNVMIYFDPLHQQRLISRIADALAPGGYLFLGHTETLRGVSEAFRMVSLRPGIAYQRVP
jgi:chemotaxis protein methyltransferase CheR